MNVILVAFGAVTLNVCVCKCFWFKCLSVEQKKKEDRQGPCKAGLGKEERTQLNARIYTTQRVMI